MIMCVNNHTDIWHSFKAEAAHKEHMRISLSTFCIDQGLKLSNEQDAYAVHVTATVATSPDLLKPIAGYGLTDVSRSFIVFYPFMTY